MGAKTWPHYNQTRVIMGSVIKGLKCNNDYHTKLPKDIFFTRLVMGCHGNLMHHRNACLQVWFHPSGFLNYCRSAIEETNRIKQANIEKMKAVFSKENYVPPTTKCPKNVAKVTKFSSLLSQVPMLFLCKSGLSPPSRLQKKLIFSPNSVVTLKSGSRSLKSNQFFQLSQ